MMHGLVIYPGKPDESFIAALHTIRNVKWKAILPSEEVDNAAAFDELQPAHGNMVIILDPACTTFGYLSGLVRNGCHLFLAGSQQMSYEERVRLYQLAEEGNTFIQNRNDLLFHPSLSMEARRSRELKLIEIHHIAPGMPDRLQEMLYSNLLTMLKIADSEPNRMSVCSIPDSDNQASVVNVHLNFHNGSAASLTLSFSGDKEVHLLTEYSAKGVMNYILSEAGPNPEKLNSVNDGVQLFWNDQLIRQIAGFTDSLLRKNHQRFYLSEEARTFQLIEKINKKLEYNSVMV